MAIRVASLTTKKDAVSKSVAQTSEEDFRREAMEAVNELLEYIEQGRPSSCADWRNYEKEQMIDILLDSDGRRRRARQRKIKRGGSGQ